MQKAAATLIILSLTVTVFVSPSYAASIWECFITGGRSDNCRAARAPDPVEETVETSEDLANLRQRTIQLNENGTSRERGYVRGAFSFHGQDGTYDLSTPDVERLFDRSLADWFVRYFSDDNSIFMLTVEFLEGSDVIWAAPVFAVDQRETFNLVQYKNDVVLNGHMPFWVASDTNLNLRLRMLQTRDVEIDSDDIVRAFDIAAGLVGVFERVVSPVPGLQLTSYENDIDELKDIFSKFSAVEELTITTDLDAQTFGGTQSVLFNFDPPSPRSEALTLLVELDYTESRLTDYDLDGILQTRLYTPGNQQTPELLSYIAGNAVSRQAFQRTGTYQSDVLAACGALREALLPVLIGADIPIALNAILYQADPSFLTDFNPACFRPGQDRLIADKGFPVFAAQPLPVEPVETEMSNDDLHDFAEPAALLLRNRASNRDGVGPFIRTLQFDSARQPRNFTLFDPDNVLGDFIADEAHETAGIQVATAFLATEGGRVGCYSRRVYDDARNENTYSFLFELEDGVGEVVIDFTNRALPNTEPVVDQISVFRRSPADVARYELVGTQACKQWAPWAQSDGNA